MSRSPGRAAELRTSAKRLRRADRSSARSSEAEKHPHRSQNPKKFQKGCHIFAPQGIKRQTAAETEGAPINEFETIYRENAEGIYRFLFRMCKNQGLAEELTQECFYRAFCSFHRYDGSCRIFTWLAAIAKNLYFKHLRSIKEQKTPACADERLPSPEDACPEEVLLRMEETRAVRLAIGRLPGKYRDVVILRTYAELPFEQIAALLSVSCDSARVLYCRAKAKLREELSKDSHEYPERTTCQSHGNQS